MSSTDPNQKEYEKFVNVLRQQLPRMTAQELDNLAVKIPLKKLHIAAKVLNIPNFERYDQKAMLHAIKAVILGEGLVTPIELKENEEGREETTSKRARQQSQVNPLADPLLLQARQATLSRFPEEWEKKRQALLSQSAAIPEFPLNLAVVSNRPGPAVMPPARARSPGRNAPTRRLASAFEERGAYSVGRGAIEEEKKVLLPVEEKVPALAPETEDIMMFAEPTTTKKRRKPISKYDEPIPNVVLEATQVDFGPASIPFPPLPKNMTELAQVFQSPLLQPLGITSVNLSAVRLLQTIFNINAVQLQQLQQVVDNQIAEVQSNLAKATAYAQNLAQANVVLPKIFADTLKEVINFYQTIYLPQLLQFKSIMARLLTHKNRDNMAAFLREVVKTKFVSQCLAYVFNAFAAEVKRADWQYKMIAKIVKPEIALKEIEKADVHIKSEKQKYALSVC